MELQFVCEQKKKKKNLNSQARAEGVKILGVRSIKRQVWGFSVGQPILIYAFVGGLVAGGFSKQSTIVERMTIPIYFLHLFLIHLLTISAVVILNIPLYLIKNKIIK